MDCCEKLSPDFTGEPEIADGNKLIGRRGALKRLAGLAGGILFVSEKNAHGQGRQVLLASAVSFSASFSTKNQISPSWM
jgi:hypothetical protein